jgi:hypothetical protein
MAHFKKQGGGEFTESDLITLSFDGKAKEPEDKPKSLKEAKELLGSKFKIDGGK